MSAEKYKLATLTDVANWFGHPLNRNFYSGQEENMVIPVFDSMISTYRFDRMNEFGPGTEYGKIVDAYFNHPLFADIKAPEQLGKGITTYDMDRVVSFIDSLSLQNALGQWIIASLSQAAIDLGLTANSAISGFRLKRAWGNRIYKGTSGKVHQHLNDCHLVGIFYYEAPENSADLVFIDEYDLDKIGDIESMPPEKIHRIIPEPGMLICHSPLIPHAVSMHNNDSVRTCFVFEIEYTNH